MKPVIKYLQLLVILEILILASVFLISKYALPDPGFGGAELLSGIFTLIAAVTLIIFFRGQGKEPASQTMHSLVAITLKFLIDLILVFIWFFVAKKTGLSSVVLFFVLYLTFTLFSVIIMIKTLKGKSL